MKILFLTDNFPPEINAPATRTYEHCLEWVKQGAEVTVITCAPNFPSGRVFQGYSNKLIQKEVVDGISVVRVWTYITANEGVAGRTLDYISFALTSFLAGLFVKTDVIVATSPQFFTTLSGLFLSVCKRKPWIFELRDLWPDSIRAVGAMKKTKVLEWLEVLELFLYKKSTAVVAVTDAFKRNLISRGITAEKIHVITNGSNLDLFRPMAKNEALLEDLGLKDKFVVGYIGTHGMAHGLDFILKCAKSVADERIHFLFIGNGAEKARLKDLASRLTLKNINFLDSIPKKDVPVYISITDAALVPLRKNDVFKTVIPSKIFESAAMRKPILLGVEGQAKEIIEKYGAGLCFYPENRDSFLKALTECINNKKAYLKMQSACERLSQDYDRKTLALKMLDVLVKSAAQKPLW